MHIEQLKTEGTTLDLPIDIAKSSKQFICNNKKTSTSATESNHPSRTPKLTYSETNEQEIGKIIDSRKLKPSASEGDVSSKIIKPCKNLKNNKRPIFLVSSFSTFLERVVLTRLLNYLKRYQLLTPRQHGFITERCSNTALAQPTETIINKVEEGHTVTSVLLDSARHLIA